MRKRTALVAAVGLALALAAPASAATSKACSLPTPDGAGYYGLKVKGVSCATGKRLLRKVESGDTRQSGSNGLRFTAKVGRSTWKCKITYPAFEQGLTSCTSGGRRIWLKSGA